MRIDPTVLGDACTENKMCIHTENSQRANALLARETLCVDTLVTVGAVPFASMPLVLVYVLFTCYTWRVRIQAMHLSHKTIAVVVVVIVSTVAWSSACVFSTQHTLSLFFSLSEAAAQIYNDIVVRFMLNVSWNLRKSAFCFFAIRFFLQFTHCITSHCIWSSGKKIAKYHNFFFIIFISLHFHI